MKNKLDNEEKEILNDYEEDKFVEMPGMDAEIKKQLEKKYDYRLSPGILNSVPGYNTGKLLESLKRLASESPAEMRNYLNV